MTVLVADDDEDLRSLLAETFRADGYRVIEAHDGAELLEHLRAGLAGSGTHPDVVVTDVLMPKLSGLGVLDALRRAQWNVPVDPDDGDGRRLGSHACPQARSRARPAEATRHR